MRRTGMVLLGLVVVGLICVNNAEAKAKKGTKPAPLTAEQIVAGAEKDFARMTTNIAGRVTEAAFVEFKKVQNPNYTQAEAEKDTKIIYPRILEFVKGDKSQGFNLEEFKAFKAASVEKKK